MEEIDGAGFERKADSFRRARIMVVLGEIRCVKEK